LSALQAVEVEVPHKLNLADIDGRRQPSAGLGLNMMIYFVEFSARASLRVWASLAGPRAFLRLVGLKAVLASRGQYGLNYDLSKAVKRPAAVRPTAAKVTTKEALTAARRAEKASLRPEHEVSITRCRNARAAQRPVAPTPPCFPAQLQFQRRAEVHTLLIQANGTKKRPI
jgi:hypothetical protein